MLKFDDEGDQPVQESRFEVPETGTQRIPASEAKAYLAELARRTAEKWSGPFLLDTNVIDKILDTEDLDELIVKSSRQRDVVFYVTHLAIGEVEAIRAERDERRKALLQILAELPADRIPTSIVVTDVSRLDEARLAGDAEAEEYELLTGGNVRHAEDAILALTARSIGATIVSEDKHLRRMADQLSITCLNTIRLREVLVGSLGRGGLLPVRLTFVVPDGVGPEGCHHAEEVSEGVQA